MEQQESDERPRLDPQEFVTVYRWLSENLGDSITEHLDKFLAEDIWQRFPGDVATVYAALAEDADRDLRALVAIGLDNLFKYAPEDAVRIAAKLIDDRDEAVAAQARETLRDLPSLLTETNRLHG